MLVTGRSADASLECLAAVVGSYRPATLAALWESVPPELRLMRFSAGTVPARYRGAFAGLAGGRTRVDLSPLPEPMRQELTWCMFRIIECGGTVSATGMGMLARRLTEVTDILSQAAPCSLTTLPVREWQQRIARAVHQRTGRLPVPGTAKTVREQLLRCLRLLWVAYDPRPWWQREMWDPTIDARIPLRAHEPLGRQTVYFHHLKAGWLRRGVQWCCKVTLETGAWTWSTVHERVKALVVFDRFLAERGVRDPWLADEPAQVRALLLDFLGHVRALPVAGAGPAGGGQARSPAGVKAIVTSAERFYAFMSDNKDAAAAALGDRAWLRLGPQHERFYRPGELPRTTARTQRRQVIDDAAFSQIMAHAGMLAEPAGAGGLGDEQAMRILMLLARTGRRANEICMLDRDPLLTLSTAGLVGPGDPGGFVARLRYQQTKIDGAWDSIPVDAEIVAIIRAQQQWADRFLAARGWKRPPRYLFVGLRMNRNGDRPYSRGRLHILLGRLARRLDIRDSAGQLVDFQRTHRFRHTRATGLLNAGVPIHVVQRYLGHLTPAMTMTYAQTLAATHEREFLRYRKITADARDLDVDPRDLYDMLELDKRTDRILPNGWCLLPPRQLCDRGNACLTCDKFATDATFLPELTAQRSRTEQLIAERREAFKARTGHDMGDDNIWLAGRRQERGALGRIIARLEQTRLAGPSARAVRGAGVAARVDAVTTRQESR